MELDSLPELRLGTPTVQLPLGGDVTLATIARLVASGRCSSKSELAVTTGLARTTITGSVDKLIRSGTLVSAGTRPHSGRGRPAEALEVAPDAGLLIIFDCGVTSANLTLVDMRLKVLSHQVLPVDMTLGPHHVMPLIISTMREMVDALEIRHRRRCAIIGLPARMDYSLGAPVRPATMPLWDGFEAGTPIREAFRCHVIVENDANLRALGEARSLTPDQVPLMTVKIGTGIGAGLVTEDGMIHRGVAGASGEMGHITLRSAPDVKCRCGNTACLEAVASIPALLANYRERADADADPPSTGRELVELLRGNDPVAEAVLRDSAAYLGEAVAHMVNIFNPARVVITGIVTSVSDDLLARVRAVVYEQGRPLATRHLQITYSTLGTEAGTAGAAVLGIEHLLSPNALTAAIRRQTSS